MRYLSWACTRYRGGDDCSDLLRRFDKVRIGKVGVACRGAMPVKPEEAADERQRPERRSGQHVEQVERRPGEPRADRQQGQAGRARAEQLEALIRSARELQPELQKRPAD
ncbi:MAG: hypothetical protein OXF33_02480 [Rhodospirillales bacterium]|nr:hypothetical protein [Rhodospirillales bacterium]MCY4002561.1 hypothetical protein [Rhodospirillales bacterium]